MLATITLARRIEAAEGRLAADFARAVAGRWPGVLVAPVGDGVAVWVGPDQPFNKLVALALGETVDESALALVERAFEERGAALQVELATLADGRAAALLARRGYVLSGFENVLALALGGETCARLAAQAAADCADGLAVEPAGTESAAVWVDAVVTGFAHPDTGDGPPSHESFPREALARVFDALGDVPGYARYLARREGTVAGGGSLRAHAGVALLCGAATLPAHRRRGVQSVLLRARLLDAARDGCDLAVVTTQPGSKSMENVMRAGFELLYARAILVRAPAASGGGA